jgi:hypothetical protein
MAAVVIGVYDIALLVQDARQPFVAQRMLGRPMFHLDHSFRRHIGRGPPAITKDLVTIRVCKRERAVLKLALHDPLL